jgi:hypothetical protein
MRLVVEMVINRSEIYGFVSTSVQRCEQAGDAEHRYQAVASENEAFDPVEWRR